MERLLHKSTGEHTSVAEEPAAMVEQPAAMGEEPSRKKKKLEAESGAAATAAVAANEGLVKKRRKLKKKEATPAIVPVVTSSMPEASHQSADRTNIGYTSVAEEPAAMVEQPATMGEEPSPKKNKLASESGAAAIAVVAANGEPVKKRRKLKKKEATQAIVPVVTSSMPEASHQCADKNVEAAQAIVPVVTSSMPEASHQCADRTNIGYTSVAEEPAAMVEQPAMMGEEPSRKKKKLEAESGAATIAVSRNSMEWKMHTDAQASEGKPCQVDELEEPVELQNCIICGEPGDQSKLLLCDGKIGCGVTCNAGYHYDCIGLTEVPKGDWFCPECRPSANKEANEEAPLDLEKSSRLQKLLDRLPVPALQKIVELIESSCGQLKSVSGDLQFDLDAVPPDKQHVILTLAEEEWNKSNVGCKRQTWTCLVG